MYFSLKFLLSISVFLFISACSVPGTYMTGNSLQSSQKYVKGKLLRSSIIPIDLNLMRTKTGRKNFQPPLYRIGAHDALSIVVWEHPELSVSVSTYTTSQTADINGFNSYQQNNSQGSSIVVDGKGYVFFPFIGKIRVIGLTVDQIRGRLTKRLARYIRNPQISVHVSAYLSQQVQVIGAVRKPGSESITGTPLSILGAINHAGGVDPISSNPRCIYLIRGSFNNVKIYWLNAKSPEDLLLASKFYLKSGDIIYVAHAGIASWNRVVSQILPTLQTIWYTHTLLS